MKQMYNSRSNEKSFLTTGDVNFDNGRVTAENCSNNVYQKTTVTRTVTVFRKKLTGVLKDVQTLQQNDCIREAFSSALQATNI